MHRSLPLLLSSFLAPAVVAAPAQARDLPWMLVQAGTTLQRFVDHRDNAAACSIARSRRASADGGALDALHCVVGAQPAVEHDTLSPEYDTPTTPAMVVGHSLGAHPVRYPSGSPMDGIDRTTVLLVDVEADGRVARVGIQASSGDARMDAAAADGAMKWVYRPAMVDGRPVAGRLSIPVEFTGVARARF